MVAQSFLLALSVVLCKLVFSFWVTYLMIEINCRNIKLSALSWNFIPLHLNLKKNKAFSSIISEILNTRLGICAVIGERYIRSTENNLNSYF